MNEVEVKTINISIDEYFDLRTKANMNDLLMGDLGRLEGRFYDFERRLFDLEQKLKEGVNNG